MIAPTRFLTGPQRCVEAAFSALGVAMGAATAFLSPSGATRLFEAAEREAGAALIAAGFIHLLGVIVNGRWQLSPLLRLVGIGGHLTVIAAYFVGVALIAIETGAASPARAALCYAALLVVGLRASRSAAIDTARALGR